LELCTPGSAGGGVMLGVVPGFLEKLMCRQGALVPRMSTMSDDSVLLGVNKNTNIDDGHYMTDGQ